MIETARGPRHGHGSARGYHSVLGIEDRFHSEDRQPFDERRGEYNEAEQARNAACGAVPRPWCSQGPRNGGSALREASTFGLRRHVTPEDAPTAGPDPREQRYLPRSWRSARGASIRQAGGLRLPVLRVFAVPLE